MKKVFIRMITKQNTFKIVEQKTGKELAVGRMDKPNVEGRIKKYIEKNNLEVTNTLYDI